MKKPTKKQLIAAARRIYGRDGKCEIDDNAKVSRAKGNPDKGAYVQAWVWVYDNDASGSRWGCRWDCRWGCRSGSRSSQD